MTILNTSKRSKQMNNTQSSPKDVADSVKIVLRRKGKQKDAADTLGITPATLSAQLAGKKYLSKKVAKRLSDLYGFNTIFLTTGIGGLFINNKTNGVTLPKTFIEAYAFQETEANLSNKNNQNASLWKAFELMYKELNKIKDHYISTVKAMEDVLNLMSESEEQSKGKQIIEQIKKTLNNG